MRPSSASWIHTESPRGSLSIHSCRDPSRCRSMPMRGLLSRFRRYLPRAGALSASPAACNTSRAQLYESFSPCFSVANSQNVERLQPGYFSFNGFRHDFLLGHRSGLLGDPLLDKLHASRVSVAETEADIYQWL